MAPAPGRRAGRLFKLLEGARALLAGVLAAARRFRQIDEICGYLRLRRQVPGSRRRRGRVGGGVAAGDPGGLAVVVEEVVGERVVGGRLLRGRDSEAGIGEVGEEGV